MARHGVSSITDEELDRRLEAAAVKFLGQATGQMAAADVRAERPWRLASGGRRLEAFLGSRGIETSRITSTEGLLAAAAMVFEVPVTSIDQMGAAIHRLKSAERAKRYAKNSGRLMKMLGQTAIVPVAAKPSIRPGYRIVLTASPPLEIRALPPQTDPSQTELLVVIAIPVSAIEPPASSPDGVYRLGLSFEAAASSLLPETPASAGPAKDDSRTG
jgi:hypothetical protein